MNQSESLKSQKIKKSSQAKTQSNSAHRQTRTVERVKTTPSAARTKTKSSLIKELSSSEKLTGAIVKQARIAIGMNQRQLAKAIGMSQSWVRDLEKIDPDKPIHSKHLPKLKEVLELNYPCP
ncbi:helix-turn-helix domain-containing protein [Phormidium sp. LEGE 05292]|nr:helix-turn-helix domain-containing protein [Phormidium sp. LEGE 05292]